LVISKRHLKNIRKFQSDYSTKRCIIVSNDPEPRMTEDKIEILPWQAFLEQLWNGQILDGS
jgi:hypothetical protein